MNWLRKMYKSKKTVENDEISRVEKMYDETGKALIGYNLYTKHHPDGKVIVHERFTHQPEKELGGYARKLRKYAEKHQELFPELFTAMICLSLFLLPQLATIKIPLIKDFLLEKIRFLTFSRAF